jgi:hypothetical protein
MKQFYLANKIILEMSIFTERYPIVSYKPGNLQDAYALADELAVQYKTAVIITENIVNIRIDMVGDIKFVYGNTNDVNRLIEAATPCHSIVIFSDVNFGERLSTRYAPNIYQIVPDIRNIPRDLRSLMGEYLGDEYLGLAKEVVNPKIAQDIFGKIKGIDVKDAFIRFAEDRAAVGA